jgi:DNA (cytosine-5)-methyltransferase 1
MLTFGSLFAGIGGFDLGFERAGMQCKWQVEIDPYAQAVLKKHWPTVRRWDDVRTWPQPDTERVDVICGGFPCQDISYAGKGAGISGERSGLFYEAMRIVGEMGPRFVVLENVAALLTRGLDQVLGTLASFGFDAEWDCIPAAAFGLPHYRERVFIVGKVRNDASLRGRSSKRIFQRIEPNDSRVRARQFMQDCPFVAGANDGVPRFMDGRRGLGNSVVPPVAQWIGERILAAALTDMGGESMHTVKESDNASHSS